VSTDEYCVFARTTLKSDVNSEAIACTPIIRALLGRCDASHVPRSTLITPSMEEFIYMTLSIVETGPFSGCGRTRIGFSLRDWEIRVSFDVEYLGRLTRYCEKNFSWRNLLSSFTLDWFPRQPQFAVPPLGDRKGKPSPQISRKRLGRSSLF